MSEETTLKAALEAWMAWQRARDVETPFSPAELYEFLLHPHQHPRREEIRAALGDSPELLAELNELAASRREAAVRMREWDLALPKAAAVAGEGFGRITTAGGKYTIEIRPHLDKADHGLVVVRVAAAHREALEGEELVLEDSGGHVLLKGRVVDGEVSQELETLSQIEYGFVVRAARAEG